MNKENNKKERGFTLIEILVVVLIIGVLSAIALPSYMRSVERSKAVNPMTNLAAIARAQNSHKMANYHYTDNITKLDVSFVDVASEDIAAGDTFESEDFIYKVYGDDRAVSTATRKNVSDDKKYELSVDYASGIIYCRPIENKTCIDLGLEEGQDYSQVPWSACSPDPLTGISCYERDNNGRTETMKCSYSSWSSSWGFGPALCWSSYEEDGIENVSSCQIGNSTEGFCNSYSSMRQYQNNFERSCLQINGFECEEWSDWWEMGGVA